MEKTDGRLVGLLGTVIIHLIIGIMVMAFKIRDLHVNANLLIDLELITEFEERDRDLNEEVRFAESSMTTSIERALRGDEELLNIARNLASAAANPIINRDDYIDMIKDELIRSGQLGEDNYIDRQRRQSANSDNDQYIPVNVNTPVARNEERRPSEQEFANYGGPTRINYFLEGRTHTHLPTPIYRCQGSGTITLRIEVNQRGEVERAIIITRESVNDECLSETAVSSALVSKFNPDINAPRIQTGTLTFQFVAQ